MIDLGHPWTAGLGFPGVVGTDLVLLVRRNLYPVGEWYYCGVAEADAGAIFNGDGYPHEASMGYQYAAAFCHANGYRSPFCEPVRVDFDAVPAVITPALPMWPQDVVATAIADGKYRVTWSYDPWGQGGWPTDFQVFGGLPGAVNYGAPLTDSVTGLTYTLAEATRQSYYFTTGVYADGAKTEFGVRARNSGGVAEKNTHVSPWRYARDSNPAAATLRSWRHRRWN
jgi:hypothetical protein